MEKINYKIEGIEISLGELCERIGDLFYDDLAQFLSDLSEEYKNKKIGEFLKNASSYIEDALDICEKHTPKGGINSKHSAKVKGIELNNKELAKKIGNLENETFEKFLLYLSLKISRDSYADKMRGREMLSNNLKGCASSLLEEYKILGSGKEKSSNIKNVIEIKINKLLGLH